MIDEFFRLHPLATLVFYISVIGISISSMHYGIVAISLIAGLVYLAVLRKMNIKLLGILLVVFVISAIINPLFSHKGMTVLFINYWGNAVTLEAIIYGLVAAQVVCCSLIWFSSFNTIMTEDKILALIGNIMPNVATLLSMTIRMVDRLKRKYGEVKSANIGLEPEKLKSKIKFMSIVITWLLENSIDTSLSMEARGYGLRKRTSFSNYKIDRRDVIFISWILILTILEIVLIYKKNIVAYYYPVIKVEHNIILYFIFFLHSFSGVLLDLGEEIRWRRLRSKI